MKKSLLLLCISLFLCLEAGAQSACNTCTVTSSTFTANLSANPNSTYTVSSKRTNFCCQASGSDNCVRFEVTVHPQAAQISFLVSSGNNGTWEINCTGPAYTPGQKPCLGGIGTSFCITYCNPGNNTDTYTITTSSGLSTGADISLREGCAGQLTVGGLNESSIIWNSVFPGAAGAYNSYLSCTTACDTTNITPGAGAPAFIDYQVCGTATGCSVGTYCDTQRVYTYPAMTLSINPTSPVLCSAGSGSLTLTATPTGGNAPYTYTWTPGGASTSTLSVSSAGPYSVAVNDNTTCGAVTQTVTVTSAPTPTASATPATQSICSGSATSIALSSTAPGTTYTWTVAQSGVTGAANGSGSSITQTLSTTSTSTGTATYTVIPTAAGCTGSPIVVTVTVNPIPTATATPNSQSICSGSASSITLSSNVSGTTYSWTVGQSGVSGASNGSGSSIAQTITTNTNSTGTATYTIIPTASGCPGAALTATVTVNPLPVMTSASTATICSGGTVSIPLTSDVASTYTWIAANNANTTGESLTTQSTATLSNTITNSTSVIQSVIYTVTPTSSGGSCLGTSQTVTVTVNPTPAMTNTNSITICSGATVGLALTSNIASTYTWIATNNANTSGESVTTQTATTINDAITNSTTSVQTVIYTVTPTSTSGSCPGTSQTISVTVNPTPAMTNANTTTICSGASVALALTSNVASTYTWIAANNANTSGESIATQTATTISDVITNTTTSAQSVIYTVTPTSSAGSCVGTSQTITVTVNPTPAMTSASTATICSGGTVGLALTSNVASTYTWVAANNANTSGESVTTQTATTINDAITNSTTSLQNVIYTVTPTSSAGSCVGTSQTVTISVNPTPAMTNANAVTICSGGTVGLVLTSNVASTYTWIAANNANTSGESVTTQTATTINDAITNSTTSVQTVIYTVTPTSSAGSCPGTSQTITVTVNPTPAMTNANTKTICSGVSVALALTSNVASTYTWIAANNANTSGESITTQTATTIGDVITNSTTSPQTVIYTVTPTSSAGSCVGTSQTITVTVNPTPSMTNASTKTICSGASVALALTSNVASTYTWIATNNANTSGESVTTQTATTINDAITNSTTSVQTVIYTVTPTSSGGGCAGPAQTITITVNPTPTMTNANTVSICSGGSVGLALTSNVASTYTWIAANNANTTGESITTQTATTISDVITNTTTSAQNIIYTVTPTSSAGSCVGTSQTITVTVNPAPVMTSATTATICSGGTVGLALTSNVASIYTWIAANNANTTGESITTQTATTINDAITNSTTSVQTVIYTVTPTSSAGSCVGAAQTVSVTVNPIPAMTSASSATICSGGTVSIALTSNVASTYTWIAANNANTSGESITTQTATTINDAITNSTTSVQTVIYTVTPTSSAGSCAGVSQTVSVTVNPTPAMTNANTATICSGGAVGLALTSNVASTYTWIAANNANTSGESITTQTATTINDVITNTTTSVQSVIYTVTPTSTGGSCMGTSQTVTITVNPAPTMTSAGTATICSGGTVSIPLTASIASNFTWIASDNPNTTGESTTTQSTSTLSNTISNSTTSVQVVVYTVTPTSTAGGCAGPAQTVSVTVNPIPTMTSANTATICSGGTVNIPFTSNVASTYTWIAANNGSTTGESLTTQSTATLSNTITNTTTSVQTVIYTVTPTSTAASCAGISQTVSVTVNPTPVMTSAGTATICSGNTVSIPLTSNVASTYTWIAANNANTTGESITTQTTSTLSDAITNNTATPQNVIYTVTPTSTGGSCVGTSQTVTVTVNPTPAMTSASTATICSGGTFSMPLTSNVASTYTWTATNNPNTTGESVTTQTTSTINNTLTSSTGNTEVVVYTVTPTSTGGGCPGAAQTVSVTVSPTPVVTVTPTSQSLCSGGTTSIVLTSNVGGAGFSWTVTQTGVTGASASSGATIAQTLTATGTSAGTAVYTITPSVGSCVGSPATATVTVNPAPSLTVTPSSQNICSGNATSITFTSNVVGTTYAWTVSQNSVSGASAGSGAGITQTLTATGTSPGTAVYTVTPTVGGCPGADVIVTVTVNPTPSATATPSSQAICAGSAASIILTSDITGTAFTWTVSQSGVSGASNGSGTSITQTLSTTGASPGTATYTIAPSVGGCPGATVIATVTVNPIPATPTVSSNSPVCITNTINLSTALVSGATYSWSGPNSYTSSAQNPSIPNASTAEAGTYTLNITVNGCTSANQTVTVVVNTPPPATLFPTSNSPLCTGQTLTLSIGAITSASYSWTGPSTFTSSLQNPTIGNVNAGNAGTYSLNVTVPGCAASGSGTVSVIVNPTPAAPVAGNNGPICEGDNLNLTATGTGTSYSWTGPNTFTSTTQNPTISGVTSANAGVYSVTTTDNGCTSAAGTTTVTITPLPTVNAGPDQIKCKSSINTALNGTVTVSGTGTWSTLGSGSFTPNANTLNATYVPSTADTSAGSVTLVLTSTGAPGCAAVTDTMVITFTDIPVVQAGSNQTLCANNANASLNGSVTVGSTSGNWTTSGTGTFTPSSNTLNATYIPSSADTAAGSVTLTLTSIGGCIVVTDNLTITFSNAPGSNAGADIFVCSNNPNATINGTVSGATNTGVWSTNGGGTFNPSNTSLSATYVPTGADISAGSVFIILSSTGNGTCNPAIDTLLLTFTPPPSAFAGNDTSFCATSTLTLGGIITGGSGTGTWTTSGSGTFSPNANTLNATYIPSAADTATGNVTLTLTSTNNGGCLAANDQVFVNITDGPTITGGADQAVCANNNVVTLNGSVTVSSGVSWSTLGDGSFSSTTSSSTTYTPGTTDVSSGNATIVITSTGNGGCAAITDTVNIQIQPVPVVNAGNNQFICSGVASTTISGTVTTSGTGTWSTLGSGSFGNAGSLSTTYTLSPADTLAGSVSLVLTSTNNGACVPVTDTVLISITPAGFASAGADTSICANVASVSLAGIINGGNGTGVWTTSGTGTFTPSASTLNAAYVPSATDITAGTVTLTLTPNSCMPSSDVMVITFAPTPVVSAGSDLFICATTNTVALNGSVSGGSTTGTWSTLGSGSFSPGATTLNATYQLSLADSTAGSVTLVLTSTNNGSCNAVTDTVNISLTSTASAMAGTDTTICSSTTSIALGGIINGGTGAGVWTTSGTGTFTPNDSTLNASYSPSGVDISGGSVVLTLTPINACQPAADSLVLTITPEPVVDAGTDIFVCVSTNTVALNGSVTGGTSTGSWATLGSGSFNPNNTTLNAVYTLSTADSTAGTVTLVLTSSNNGVCNAVSDTVVINTTTATSAIAGVDTTICGSDSLAMNGIINGGSAGQWSSSGTGTFSPSGTTLNAYYLPSAADISSGSVVLTLTPSNGCQPLADSLVLNLDEAPVVSAGSNTVICASTTTVSLNGSISGGSTTGNWTTSGTGSFSPSPDSLNATYTISQADSAAGSVTLVLTSTNSGSCGAVKDSITVNITTPASALAGSDATVCGNNASVLLGGTITGGTGQGQWSSSGSGSFSPADTVLNGTYNPSAGDISAGTVVLTLTPLNSCSPAADSLVVTITPAPTVNAGNDTTVCGGTSAINLNGSINGVPGGALWTSSGTGTFSPNDSTLNASYTPAGTDGDTLIFVLTTTGNGLCNAVTDTIRYIRNVSPVANFAFSNFCAGQSIAFADSTTGPVVSWNWNFGNGDTDTTQNPTYTYTASGTYTVSLHVSGGAGCDDSISKVITVQPAPVASFSLTNACLADSVSFTSTSSVTPGSIASWNWGFGDGNTSTQQNPVHHYDSVKVYTVSLTVISDSGCSASVTQTVSINPSPLAGFTTQSSCGSLQVNFNDTTNAAPDSITVWSWSFGDGNVSNQSSPANTYSAVGSYTVLLQVQTSNGCTDTVSTIVNLGQNVLADYIPNGGSYNTGQGISFTNQSSGATLYDWAFGDNTFDSTNTDPTHTYSQPGTYTVVLVASNSLGCTDTVYYVFEIKTKGVTAPTGFTPDGDGINDGFYIMGGPFSSYELRVFNEWGNEIFASSSQSDKWDGTYKGAKQPAGTYVYIFNGTTVEGQIIKWQKEINLIR